MTEHPSPEQLRDFVADGTPPGKVAALAIGAYEAVLEELREVERIAEERDDQMLCHVADKHDLKAENQRLLKHLHNAWVKTYFPSRHFSRGCWRCDNCGAKTEMKLHPWPGERDMEEAVKPSDIDHAEDCPLHGYVPEDGDEA